MSVDKIYKLPDENADSGAGILWPSVSAILGVILLTCWIATQYTAYKLGYQPALGAPLFGKVYAPWKFFVWWISFGHVVQAKPTFVVGEWILFGLHFLIIIPIWFAVRRSRRMNEKTDLHGSARWADLKDIKRASLINKAALGVYIGAWVDDEVKQKIIYLTHNGPEHVFVYAPTRSGKGICIVLPTMLSWHSSVIVYDIKGELWALTSGYRKAIGHKVIKFDATSIDGSGACWNPLEEIRVGTLYEVKDAQNIATMLADPTGKESDDHWVATSRDMLTGVILYVLHKSEDKSIKGIKRFLSDPSRSIEETMEMMLNIRDHLNVPGIEVVSGAARDILDKAENEAASVISSAKKVLGLWDDPIVAMNTSRSDFHLYDLMNHEKPSSLYLVVPPSDRIRLTPLTRLFFNMFVGSNTEKMDFKDGRSVASYKHRMLVLIDEFPSLGRMDQLVAAMAYSAGYGIKFLLIAQGINQLYDTYTQNEIVTTSCHVQAAFAPNDEKSAELISKRTGQTTVNKQQRSYSGSRIAPFKMHEMATAQETERPLLKPDEVQRLPALIKDEEGNALEAGDMLIFVAGYYAIYGKQIMYFADPVFDARSKIPAPHQSDVLFDHPQRRAQAVTQSAQAAPTVTVTSPAMAAAGAIAVMARKAEATPEPEAPQVSATVETASETPEAPEPDTPIPDGEYTEEQLRELDAMADADDLASPDDEGQFFS